MRVECDANERIFRSEAFDLVVGRSVLHHLLDYDVMLKACHEVLKPNGAVVLFEPVLEGKTIVNLLMALMLRFDVRSNEGVFSRSERQALLAQIGHQRKPKGDLPTREQLATFEDKYIFEIEQLRAVGRAAGFSDVEFRNNGELDPTYWGYLANICQSIGLPVEKVALYRWIGQTFANVYSVVFPDQLVTPMGFFVFRK